PVHVMDELLADETGHAQEIRGDLHEVCAAGIPVDLLRQVIENDGRDHPAAPPSLDQCVADRSAGRSAPAVGNIVSARHVACQVRSTGTAPVGHFFPPYHNGRAECWIGSALPRWPDHPGSASPPPNGSCAYRSARDTPH